MYMPKTRKHCQGGCGGSFILYNSRLYVMYIIIATIHNAHYTFVRQYRCTAICNTHLYDNTDVHIVLYNGRLYVMIL